MDETRKTRHETRKAGKLRGVVASFSSALIVCTLCALCLSAVRVVPAISQEAPVFYGYIKLGLAAISQDGDAASTIESYNISRGLTFSKILLNGKVGQNKSVSLDIQNVTEHQMKGSLEFAAPGLFNVRFDGTRLRYLRPGPGTPEFSRELGGVAANLTPQRWLKLYGGVSFQEKLGDRVALLTDGLDFPGTSYDYSSETRNAGSQLRWKGRSIEVDYVWRQFESRTSSLLNRDGRRLRVTAHGPVVSKFSFSGSYVGDKSIFDETGAAVYVESYSGMLTFVPARFLTVSGHVNHKNAEDDLTRLSSRVLTAGGKASVRPYPSITTEAGYEHARRTSIPETAGTPEGKRELSSNSFLAGITARFSDKTKLLLRYRTRTTDRTEYEELTGPFDTDNFISKLEGWANTYVQYSLAFEDRERSNEELMTAGRNRGFTVFANITPPSGQYPPTLRLSGSVFRSKFTEPHGSFVTDNVLLSARLKYRLVGGLSAEGGITHIDVRKDLDIRKDIAIASMQYEFVSGYAIELRYDLFSYDDLLSSQRNYAANVVTLNFSKKFGSDYSEN